MKPWLLFFLGTPQRFLMTVAAAVLAFGLAKPDVVEGAVSQLLGALGRAVQPFIGPALTLAILVIGLMVIFRGLRGRRK